MKLKLDENLDTRLSALLKQAGHDVLTVRDQSLLGIEDQALYELCIRERSVLVSLDKDFSNVLRFSPRGTPRLVVLRGPDDVFLTMRILIQTLIQALAIVGKSKSP
jgi:predicted nuclease of predicted toxin-antitoxin system